MPNLIFGITIIVMLFYFRKVMLIVILINLLIYFCKLMKKLLFLLTILFGINAQSQIVIDNAAPYNSTAHLVNNVLLGGGIVVSNPSFIGAPDQIGFFNGINSNLGIDNGIVLSTGDISDIIGPNNSDGDPGTSFFF